MDSHFKEEELEQARKMSFLLNHITLENRCIIFKYNNHKIKYNVDYSFYVGDFKSHMFSMIKNDQSFITNYTTFLRDWKIDKILK